MSIDPEASVFPSRSPYLYASNNPISRVDPLGDTDYWSQSGRLVGTDGENNGRHLILVNDVDVDKALANHYGTGISGFFNRLFGNGNQGVTRISEFASSGVEVPSLEVRQAILAAVERSNGTTSDDTEGGFHEEGGFWGEQSVTGELAVVNAKPGAFADLRSSLRATINPFDAADPALGSSVNVVLGEFHVHPSGTLVVGDEKSFFDQYPSPGDVLAIEQNWNNRPQGYVGLVAGARDKTLYLYGTSQQNQPGKTYRASIPLDAILRMNQTDMDKKKEE
jgi:hypothetical protein